MKKFLTFVLVLAMVLSVSSFAMAAEIEVSSTDDLQTKINNATAGDTIKLTGDITLTNRVDVKKQLTIDLNGHNISGNVSGLEGMIYIGIAGNLTIKATVGGSITNNGGLAIGNYGNLTVEGGTITGDPALYNFNDKVPTYWGKATIKGGEFNGTAKESILNCGELTIEGGTINDTLDSTAKLTITNGTIENLELDTPDYNTDETNTSVTGGTFTGTVVSKNDGGGTAQAGFISGGEFSEKPADELLATKAVAVDNTEGGFKVLQEPDESNSPDFTVIPGTRNFGSTVQGTPFAAETFTVYNSGTGKLKVKLPEMENCTVKWADASFDGELTPISGGNYKADFTVQPNADLAAGEYTVKGVVKAEQYNDELNEGREITVKFTITAPATTPSSGGGYYGPDVWYIGGNTFGTNTNQVPTSVEIDQVPVSFTMNGSQITVDCIQPGSGWVTVRWGSVSNYRSFTPDANAYCAQAVIPKTGGMSIWAAIAQFLGF